MALLYYEAPLGVRISKATRGSPSNVLTRSSDARTSPERSQVGHSNETTTSSKSHDARTVIDGAGTVTVPQALQEARARTRACSITNECPEFPARRT